VNAVANVNLNKKGQVLSFGHTLFSPKQASLSGSSGKQLVFQSSSDEIALSPSDATAAFAQFLNMSMVEDMKHSPENMDNLHETTFEVTGFPGVNEPIPVKLKYIQLETGELSLVWDMVVDLHDNWYHSHVCTKTGKYYYQ
jgi:hypothetical protein